MYKLKERKGFTLAELLIVVAIIAVLVAIAIPVFTTQLERSREATDVANIRSAYANAVTEYLQTNSAQDVSVTATARNSGWETSPAPTLKAMVDGAESDVPIGGPAGGSGTYHVKISADGTSIGVE